jgi:DNA-directed RNA polymerase subunit RPC12/RpoP
VSDHTESPIEAASVKPPKQKRAVGRGVRIRPQEKSVIQSLALTGMSAREIARQLDRSTHAVCRVLNAEEMKELREMTRSALMQNALGFADDLIKASRVGAAKGRYEAALQALLGLKAIDNPKRGHGGQTWRDNQNRDAASWARPDRINLTGRAGIVGRHIRRSRPLAKEYPRLATAAYTLTVDERVRLHEAERRASANRRVFMPTTARERAIVDQAKREGFSILECHRCDGPLIESKAAQRAVCLRCGHRETDAIGHRARRFRDYTLGVSWRPAVSLVCSSCGRKFDATRKDARVCGPRCRKRVSRRADRRAIVTDREAA